jgi:hypothetical protein
MAKVDPCALLTREEAESILVPLDWKLFKSGENDPTFMLSCAYDELLRGDTPEKSLTVRVIAPNMWQPSYAGELLTEGASLIPRQEVGLDSEPVVRNAESRPFPLAVPLCKAELPCVVSREGSEWLRLMLIMPDRSALRVEILPQNVDNAKQIARTILERLPIK